MIRYGYGRLIGSIFISVLIGASVSSCSKQEEPDVTPLPSDKEITFSLSEWTPIVQSRASLFENENGALYDLKQGGGLFTLHAYVDSDSKTYIDGKKGWYFKDGNRWLMLDDNNQERIYYWPNSEKLNFFAYMPNSSYNDEEFNGVTYQSKETHVTIGSYSKATGQTFSCELPDVTGDDIPMQEFIYAYEAGKEKVINPATKQAEPVELKFKHPFALVNFKLKTGSYRMTINRFEFNPIYLNGEFLTADADKNFTNTDKNYWGKWETTGASQKYTAKIEKRVPGFLDDVNYNGVNYNSLLSNWFVVMPQDLKGVTLSLYGKRNENDKNEPEYKGSVTFGENDKWLKGHKYIYTISCGDNNEEIYFNVEVEKWATSEYEQNVPVE